MVPCLCFFVSEKTLEQLQRNGGNNGVRSIFFQKEFAVYCTYVVFFVMYIIYYLIYCLKNRGILKLSSCIVEATERSVRSQLKDKGFVFDKPIPYDPSKNDQKTLYIGDENSGFIHKFLCEDEGERNEWLFSIQKLIRKRAESQMRRRNGSLNNINASINPNSLNTSNPVITQSQAVPHSGKYKMVFLFSYIYAIHKIPCLC